MTKIKTKFKQTEIGLISEGWRISKINDCCKIVKKQFKPSNKDIRKYIGLEHIAQNSLRLIEISTTENIRSNKFEFESEQILFGKLRPYFRKVYLPKFDGVCSTDIWVIDTQGQNDQTFFFYFFADNRIVKEASNSSAGTRMPRARWDYLGELEFLIPSSEEQKKIGKILYDLDTKIENLQKQNKILEQIAQAIFKSWFVDFDGHTEFVDSELGKIPKGWKINPICKFGKIICGKTPPKYNKEFFGGDMLFIKIPDMHNQSIVISTEDSLSSKGEKFQKNKILPAGSICVSCIATIGLVSITSKRSQTNQQINSIIPNQKSLNYYLFFSMKLLNRDLLNVGSGGSATPNINTNTFSNMKIINPDPQILEIFYNLVHPMFSKLLSNTYELKSLTFIRDSLLPKLISGEIRV